MVPGHLYKAFKGKETNVSTAFKTIPFQSIQGKAATMNSKALTFVVVAAFLVWIPTTSAFNITRLLGQYPNFSTFNDYLTQTHLAEQINRRRTITILAVDNSAIGGISGRSLDVVKRILSTHIILDYYDQLKLSDLSKKSTLLTTLYQTTGVAASQQGFLNVTKKSTGDIVFGSAVKGSPLNSTLVQQVATQPYNISVLQVSSPIIAPGLDGAIVNTTTTPPPSPAATPKKAPAEAPAAEAPGVEAPTEEATSPESSDAPSDAPANTPVADGPAGSPSSSVPADAKTPSKSSSTRATSIVSLLIVVGYLILI